ncbi:hypothetical protein [Lacticaseibacillus zhaodongensis]|uniref:hypothetical protein n=1 Tax=Lacticaseibacillus zhaodongensis TaxID=2668065 RepID=UPI0012D35833|nr:hypothetical protein [Lacticaseibacillus zhaodongensis]
MAKVADDLQDFYDEEEANPDGELVRLEFFDKVDFDPKSDPVLSKMGDWHWNDAEDHMMLITKKTENYDEPAMYKEMKKLGIPVTAFEVRHINAGKAEPALME